MRQNDNKPILLIGSLSVCLLAAYIGSLFTMPEIENWYAFINKPSFTPPNEVFSPVWTLLFIMMGVSLFLIISQKKKNKYTKQGLILFGCQLILNILWSFLFFGWHEILAALSELFSLWSILAATILVFWKINKAAAYLLIPYLAWLSFAFVLNFFIVLANR